MLVLNIMMLLHSDNTEWEERYARNVLSCTVYYNCTRQYALDGSRYMIMLSRLLHHVVKVAQ